MSETVLGKVIPLYRGNYSATQEYKINDIVYYNHCSYWHKKVESTTGVAPDNTQTWAPIVVGINSMSVNSDGTFHIVYTDGRVENIGADVISAITGYLESAEEYALRAEEAALSVENPVSYSPQPGKTEAQRAQARKNIGLGNFSVVDGAVNITYEEV